MQVFAKPFVHAFDGHRDGISALAINKKSLRSFVSGSHNGEVNYLDHGLLHCLQKVTAVLLHLEHLGIMRVMLGLRVRRFLNTALL